MRFENGYQNSSENFILSVEYFCNPEKEFRPPLANGGRNLSGEIVNCSVCILSRTIESPDPSDSCILNSNCCMSRFQRARINKKELIS